MEIFGHKKLTIELSGNEIETFRQIATLAHDRMRNAPKTKMRGLPLEKQAGLSGLELINVKEMLMKFGQFTGVELRMDAEPNDKPQAPHDIIVTIWEIKP